MSVFVNESYAHMRATWANSGDRKFILSANFYRKCCILYFRYCARMSVISDLNGACQKCTYPYLCAVAHVAELKPVHRQTSSTTTSSSGLVCLFSHAPNTRRFPLTTTYAVFFSLPACVKQERKAVSLWLFTHSNANSNALCDVMRVQRWYLAFNYKGYHSDALMRSCCSLPPHATRPSNVSSRSLAAHKDARQQKVNRITLQQGKETKNSNTRANIQP